MLVVGSTFPTKQRREQIVGETSRRSFVQRAFAEGDVDHGHEVVLLWNPSGAGIHSVGSPAERLLMEQRRRTSASLSATRRGSPTGSAGGRRAASRPARG